VSEPPRACREIEPERILRAVERLLNAIVERGNGVRSSLRTSNRFCTI
jgi:hypothetical protein